MARGDRRLQRVGAHCAAEFLGALKRRQAAADEQLVPEGPVLIEQEDGLPGRSNASTKP